MTLTHDNYTVHYVHLINPRVMHSSNLVVIHTEWIQTRQVHYKDQKNADWSSSNYGDRYCLIKQYDILWKEQILIYMKAKKLIH